VVVTFAAELWIWESRRVDTWVFVSLPTGASNQIRELSEGQRRGFGSVRVRARVGGSQWRTSIFPDGKRDCYRLGITRAVRTAEGLDVGDVANVVVEVTDFSDARRSPPR
jgi:Domain of unknown function (DUF1905)